MLTMEALEEVVECPQMPLETALAAPDDTMPVVQRPRSQLALLSNPAYSIRVPKIEREVECPRCGLSFFAAGPTGFCAGEPVCDRCLFEGSIQLGMLLALASVTRGFGRLEPTTQKHVNAMLVELRAFARAYERFAARYGPPRLFRVDLTELGL